MRASSKPSKAPRSLLDHPAYTEVVERVRVLEDEVERQEQRFEAVTNIARALGGTFDLDELLRILMEHTVGLVGAERASLFLVDSRRAELWSKVMLCGGESNECIRVALGKGIVGWVAETGRVVNVADAYQDDRFNPEIDQHTGFRSRSILCVPFFDQRRRIMGAVQVLNKKHGVFDHDDELLLEAIVGHAAISIENSRLYRDLVERNEDLVEAQERLRHKMAELDLLYEVERRISSAMTLQEILDVILAKACNVVGAEAGSILLEEENSGELFFKAVKGEESEALKRLRIPVGRGIVGQVARECRPRLVLDAKADPNHDPSIDLELEFQTQSIVAAPLVVRDRCIGAIEILNSRSSDGFDEGDLKLMTLIAGQASRAISISKTREEGRRAERMTLLGQMVGGILHDLKTPMTVISGHAQLMAVEDDPEERQRHVEAVFKQFDHISAMTNEIMAFARGKREILVRKVYLHKFVEQVRDLLRLDLEQYSVTLRIDDRYRGAARFDESKITRVITNIARNACQAMHSQGGGCFTWVIDKDEDADELLFVFSDTGPGISAEIEGSLFESFSTHGKEDGTGLGLAIVKKIVAEHGGRIEHSSSPDEGATFRVTLPL